MALSDAIVFAVTTVLVISILVAFSVHLLQFDRRIELSMQLRPHLLGIEKDGLISSEREREMISIAEKLGIEDVRVITENAQGFGDVMTIVFKGKSYGMDITYRRKVMMRRIFN